MSQIVTEIVSQLPQIVQFFVPGAIFLSIFRFITYSKAKQDMQYFIFKSIIISYIIMSIVDLFKTWLPIVIKILLVDNLQTFIPIGIAIISGYVVAKIYESNSFDKALKFLNINRNVHTDFWKDVIDYKEGTYLKVYNKCTNLMYYGAVYKIDEEIGERNILLKDCDICDFQGNAVEGMGTTDIIINTREITIIEIVYNPKSNKLIR